MQDFFSRTSALFRSIFHWKFSSVFGAAWWFAGVGAMIGDKYSVAIVFYAIGAAWLLGWWLREHPASKRRQNRQKWNGMQKKELRLRWVVDVTKDSIYQNGAYLGNFGFCAMYTQGTVKTIFHFAKPQQ